MSDEYPREWGFYPDQEDVPTIDGRPLTTLQSGSGIPAEPVERGDEFPARWR